MVSKAGCSFWRAGVFSIGFKALQRGLRINRLQFVDQLSFNFIFCHQKPGFEFTKSLDPDPFYKKPGFVSDPNTMDIEKLFEKVALIYKKIDASSLSSKQFYLIISENGF
jgi:hypothetical protein